jgi:hypothetical protein
MSFRISVTGKGQMSGPSSFCGGNELSSVLLERRLKPPIPVCTENSVRIDLVTESPNFGDDGRAVMLLSDAVRLAVEVEKPT